MKNKTIEELLALLDEGVAQLLEGDEYRQYLKTMSRFPSYSMRNTLLLYKQCPQASLVAGFQTWEGVFGRHVKKGRKVCAFSPRIPIKSKQKTPQRRKSKPAPAFAPFPSSTFPRPKASRCPRRLRLKRSKANATCSNRPYRCSKS
ncbi:ArdC-like ssDNA-binding domain-containing protein [Allobaculum sp. Allo2]|uniref:ArdC-like ssDNA-binding domain-containing protein n=1 Tax=Allobaculum sp. Allo2 TaxID=2853432 RepID=UPI001F61FF0F|nr:ArdC-like ssDNA-binding domain-containing protein [Allobaculum sp. Allo2]UNT94136.1 hypothetical protein KWG61_05735 [Allobaculum sp. Allo2]